MSKPNFLCLCGLLLSMGTTIQAADDPKACNPERFEGTYRIVSGEKDGSRIPPERMQEIKVVIQRTTIVTFDREEKQVYAATYTLKPGDQGACHVTMTSTLPAKAGVSATGMLKQTPQGLKLIYALPDGPAPTKFKTVPQQHLFVLEKVDASTDAEQLTKP